LRKNFSGIITSADVENFYYEILDEYYRNSRVSEQSLESLKKKFDCTIQIEVDIQSKLFVAFEYINVTLSQEASAVNKNRKKNCSENMIELYDGTTSILNNKFQYCSNEINKIYKSRSNNVYIRYFVNKHAKIDSVDFKFVYNSYNLGKFSKLYIPSYANNIEKVTLNNNQKKGPCSNVSFQCLADNTCIRLELVCDGKRNCAYGEDESDCLKIKMATAKQPSSNYSDNLCYYLKILNQTRVCF
jgi:hypothetical protein